ncbi:MAG: FeoB-associated Cys-rich membrane protein [Acutalibacteraceae bacterium]
MEFLTENIGTIAVLAVIVLIIGAIIFKMRKDKKEGKSSCGCGCSGCPNESFCKGTGKK